MPDITVESADGSRQRFRLAKPRITIGRSRDSDIFLPDQWLSRQHAEIHEKSGMFVLLDLGSKNGTLVNGERVSQEKRLRDGDVISLGEHQLTFSAAANTPPPMVEEEPEPEGTVIFSARDLSEIRTKPATDAEELRRQNRILEVLIGATRSLLDHRPLAELFDHVLNLLLQAVPAERGAILMLEGTPPEAVVKATRSRRGKPITQVSRSLARRALNQIESLLIPNILEDADLRAQDSILSTGIRSAMCAPLWFRAAEQTQDAVIGLVYLDSLLGTTQTFTEEDLALVTALAHVAAAKIENVRLLEESLEKRRLEEDMQRASEIQRSLLPDSPPSLPGYDLSGVNFPCRAVGGDYFDYVREGDDLLFALGDVSGKGTGAALLMTVLRASVRAHWELAPAEAMPRINRTVFQNVPSNKYITFFLGRLEPREGRVSYVNAGHNPPLLVRADGSLEMLEVGGVVLGLFETTPYPQGQTTLAPGDTLVVFSDGVTETFSSADEEFGEVRLGDIVRRGRALSAGALQTQILRELESFSGGQKATDDRTLIILKRA